MSRLTKYDTNFLLLMNKRVYLFNKFRQNSKILKIKKYWLLTDFTDYKFNLMCALCTIIWNKFCTFSRNECFIF